MSLNQLIFLFKKFLWEVKTIREVIREEKVEKAKV